MNVRIILPSTIYAPAEAFDVSPIADFDLVLGFKNTLPSSGPASMAVSALSPSFGSKETPLDTGLCVIILGFGQNSRV